MAQAQRWLPPGNHQPGTGEAITTVAQAGADDVDAAVHAAHTAFLTWRNTTAQERASCLRAAAAVLRTHGAELALVDAYNTGNPVAEMIADANVAAASLEYFAGLAPMLRGETLPGLATRPDEYLHYTVRELTVIQSSHHRYMCKPNRCLADDPVAPLSAAMWCLTASKLTPSKSVLGDKLRKMPCNYRHILFWYLLS